MICQLITALQLWLRTIYNIVNVLLISCLTYLCFFEKAIQRLPWIQYMTSRDRVANLPVSWTLAEDVPNMQDGLFPKKPSEIWRAANSQHQCGCVPIVSSCFFPAVQILRFFTCTIMPLACMLNHGISLRRFRKNTQESLFLSFYRDSLQVSFHFPSDLPSSPLGPGTPSSSASVA